MLSVVGSLVMPLTLAFSRLSLLSPPFLYFMKQWLTDTAPPITLSYEGLSWVLCVQSAVVKSLPNPDLCPQLFICASCCLWLLRRLPRHLIFSMAKDFLNNSKLLGGGSEKILVLYGRAQGTSGRHL